MPRALHPPPQAPPSVNRFGKRYRSDPTGDGPHTLTCVFTGGPCAGKSTTIPLLAMQLRTLGYIVICIPENATTSFDSVHCDSAPDWSGTHLHLLPELQLTLLHQQFQLEAHAHRLAALYSRALHKPVIILADRGAVDGGSFADPHDWQLLLSRVGCTERSLLARYDLVLHLQTAAACAPGHYEFGPGAKNPHRFHNAEQALTADARGAQLWEAHPSFHFLGQPSGGNFVPPTGRCLHLILEAADRHFRPDC